MNLGPFITSSFLAAVGAPGEILGPAQAPSAAGLPDAGASVVRVCGAFFVVIALFLAGVWLYRNWQRFAVRKCGGAKLNLIEVKSLGQRQAIYVVGYQEKRMLLASTPTGITLLTHLPPTEEVEEVAEPVGAVGAVSFAEALKRVVSQRQ